MNDSSDKTENGDLEEGALYTVKQGELCRIEIDPDDTMRRVKITENAFEQVVHLQREIKRMMSGYKPDMHLVCSALINHAATKPDAIDVVRDFCLDLFKSVKQTTS